MYAGFKTFLSIDQHSPHERGLNLKKLALRALTDVNKMAKETGGGKLKNMWMCLGFPMSGIGAYADFEDNPDKEFIWRRYITDETCTRKLFRGMDRIKLTNFIVARSINTQAAFRSGLMVDYFPMHNLLALKGQRRVQELDLD